MRVRLGNCGVEPALLLHNLPHEILEILCVVIVCDTQQYENSLADVAGDLAVHFHTCLRFGEGYAYRR